MEVFDALRGDPSERHERLLDAALADARQAQPNPGFGGFRSVSALPQIALRWFDLADMQPGAPLQNDIQARARERGTAVAREAQQLYKNSLGSNDRLPGKEELAAALSRIDGPAALALLEGLSASPNDWYSADVARGLADHDPLEAEITLERVQRPNLRAAYTQGVLQRMARTDAERAITIARALPTAGEQAYSLALVASVLSAADGDQARALLAEAFDRVERAPRQSRELEDKSAAVVALAMLPMVERIEPERLEECFWRGLALRSSLPADGELNFEQQKDLCSLVTLVARYDRTVARDLLQPLVPDFRHAMGSRVHANTVISFMMIGAFARADPQWAIDLVRSLPDVPDNPLESPRQIAGLYLARELVPLGPSSHQIAGLRTLDARPSQR